MVWGCLKLDFHQETVMICNGYTVVNKQLKGASMSNSDNISNVYIYIWCVRV